jgi:hypothetical protein
MDEPTVRTNVHCGSGVKDNAPPSAWAGSAPRHTISAVTTLTRTMQNRPIEALEVRTLASPWIGR